MDNPPFSILTKICEFYLEKGIPFFLFAPSLTCFSGKNIWSKTNHIICDCNVEYDNGAVVKTSFITSYEANIAAQTAPELTQLVNEKVKEIRQKKTKQLPKYEYPENIITAATMQTLAGRGVTFKIYQNECRHIRGLDAQKKDKKSIFGSGLLLSEKAAAEKAAAEKAATEKAATEKKTVRRYELSEREKTIIKEME